MQCQQQQQQQQQQEHHMERGSMTELHHSEDLKGPDQEQKQAKRNNHLIAQKKHCQKRKREAKLQHENFKKKQIGNTEI